MINRMIILFMGLHATLAVLAQCVSIPAMQFTNPSFEGTPGAGITPSPWIECMPGETPDTQPGNWGVNLPASNGSTYVGLVTDTSGWKEGASELLPDSLHVGTMYFFTLDLANSTTTAGGIAPGCAECQLWGGFDYCDTLSLLWSSGNIQPMDTWITYTAWFTPNRKYNHLMFSNNSLGCSVRPYILLDNLGSITANFGIDIHTDHAISCNGLNDGRIAAHVTGLHPPFSYIWNTTPTQTDSVLNNVPAGNYTLTVTDANGCSNVLTVTVNQPAALSVSVNNLAGRSSASVSGGTFPYHYVWSTSVNDTTSSILTPSSGSYSVTVTDGNGCSAVKTISATGLNNPEDGVQLNMLYNSATNEIVLQTNYSGKTDLRIYDILGRETQHAAITGAEGEYKIPLQRHDNGIFLFSAVMPDGTNVVYKFARH